MNKFTLRCSPSYVAREITVLLGNQQVVVFVIFSGEYTNHYLL